MLTLIAVILIASGGALYLYQTWGKNYLAKRKNQQKDAEIIDFKGFKLNPISMIFFRWLGVPIFSSVATCLLLWVFICVESFFGWLSGWYNFSLPWFWFWSIVAVGTIPITIYFIRPDYIGPKKEVLNVPNNTAWPLTFIGTLYRFYLMEGDYPWWGKRFLLGLSTIALRDFTTREKDSERDAAGVILGETKQRDGSFKVTKVPFTLFNEKPKTDENGKELVSTLIDGVAKGGTPSKEELIITLQTFDPHLALRNDDPGLEIAERARSMFRTTISYFTALDNAVAKDAKAALIEGKTIVVAFTLKAIDRLTEGSIVRDTGGEPTYFSVEPKEGEDLKKATARTVREYKKRLATHLTPEMRAVISAPVTKKKRDGTTVTTEELVIETRSVEMGLKQIVEKNGFRLISATVGRVDLPEGYSDLAVAAEQQSLEATIQVKSARATAEALKELKSTEEEMKDPGYLDKLALAAAADPTSRAGFQRVSTDNKLATVGVAAALVKPKATETAGPATEKETT